MRWPFRVLPFPLLLFPLLSVTFALFGLLHFPFNPFRKSGLNAAGHAVIDSGMITRTCKLKYIRVLGCLCMGPFITYKRVF
ncbi:hypothetical protein BDV41DRAFT_530447 [Aspergillus transmontanensis]|uniref:Uncharacterized protein n=1 Tax=Aspergillus transmontanensis TaxID=1034304 RepID=A0A5N6W476_9EURO|nr:hypothetical protein BDV41DRAFT_530447 [Aspergillus transmontanensis]